MIDQESPEITSYHGNSKIKTTYSVVIYKNDLLGLMLTSLGVLPNFGFIQGDGDEADKFMPKVVLYYPKKGMTPMTDQYSQEGAVLSQKCVSLVWKGLLNMCHHKSLFSFLILFSSWNLH